MLSGDGEVGLLQLLVLTTHHPKRDGDCFEEMPDYFDVGMTKAPMNGVIVMKRRLLLLERISWWFVVRALSSKIDESMRQGMFMCHATARLHC
jgi:hypothetical protein